MNQPECSTPYDCSIKEEHPAWTNTGPRNTLLGSTVVYWWKLGVSYPSPPMSDPSSPTVQNTLEISPKSITKNVSMTADAPRPTVLAEYTDDIGPVNHPLGASELLTSDAVVLESNPPFSVAEAAQRNVVASEVMVQGESPATTQQHDSTESNRRVKGHVANACGNCKRAHLSCDVQRPCGRCIATEKDDTCRDVAHKKRGRPRLRESTSLQAVQSGAPVAFTSEPHGTQPAASADPSTAIGHRRGDSLRTLRSHASSISSVSTLSSTSYTRPQSRSLHDPSSLPAPQVPVVPVAFLNLDLIIVKANAAFQHLFAGLQEIRGHALSDIASPTQRDSFHAIKDSLRVERDIKDPAHLPPIQQHGQDPFQGMTEDDIEDVTRSFHDRQYHWSYKLLGGMERVIATRVRLAKSSLYFVIITLPALPQNQFGQHYNTASSRPTVPSSPSEHRRTTSEVVPPYSHQRRPSLARSDPPSPMYPFHGSYYTTVYLPPTNPVSTSARPYLPPQQRPPHPPPQSPPHFTFPAPQPPSNLPRHGTNPAATTGIPSDPSAYAHSHRRLSQHAPPIPMQTYRPGTSALSSQQQVSARLGPEALVREGESARRDSMAISAGRHLSSSSELGADKEVRSPKRRRRTMDIGDVLQ